MNAEQKSDWIRFMTMLLDLNTWHGRDPIVPGNVGNRVGFDMEVWVSSIGCGTSACAIGHWCLANPNDALHMSDLKRDRYTPREILRDCHDSDALYPVIGNRNVNALSEPTIATSMEAISGRFGIDRHWSGFCFLPDQYGDSRTSQREVVGHMLRTLKEYDSALAWRFHTYLKRRRASEAEVKTRRWHITDEGNVDNDVEALVCQQH
jgi:hypothetical protein